MVKKEAFPIFHGIPKREVNGSVRYRINRSTGPNTQWCVQPDNTVRKRIRGGWEVPVDPPSVFDCVPPSCIPTPSVPPRRANSLEFRNAQPDELQAFLDNDKLKVNAEMCKKIMAKHPDATCVVTDRECCVKSLERTGSVHRFTIYICVTSLLFEAYVGTLRLQIPFLNNQIDKFSQLDEALHYLRNYDVDDEHLRFCARQIDLVS
jgi:hypothetical protein